MLLRSRDFLLVNVNRRLQPLLRNIGDLESDLFAKQLNSVSIDRPVFITGLARSGTTMVLTLLSRAPGVATHRYRDFPFLSVPILWNRFQALSDAGTEPVERPHGDRIQITRDSPDAFEEPIWQAFFPWTHDPARCHVVDSNVDAPEFEEFFRAHIRKILWIRGGSRYVSKGNYNVGRLAYLARLMPDSRFIIPIREPLAHVHSLVKQHERFCRYALEDRRVPRYLEAAGHYEFGPQRRPMNLNPDGIGQIEEAWGKGEEYRGYARQWAEVYDYVDRLRNRDAEIAKRLLVVRFEDLCEARVESVARIMDFVELEDAEGRVRAVTDTLSAPPDETGRMSESNRQAVREEAGLVAERFDYSQA